MKIFMSTALLSFSLGLFAQSQWTNGYVVEASGDRKECLIQSETWFRNPEKVTYKLSAESKEIEAGPEDLLEFGTSGVRFIGGEFKIDMSSEDVDLLSRSAGPEYGQQYLFLRVILDGNPGLLEHENQEGQRRYFAYMKDETVQLINRQFKVDGRVATDRRFRKQLKVILAHPEMSPQVFQTINYSRRPIERLFGKYYQLTNQEYQVEEQEKAFEILVGAGVEMTRPTLDYKPFDEKHEFDQRLSIIPTVRLKYYIPRMNRKISIPFGLSYSSYSSSAMADFTGVDPDMDLSYSAVVVFFGGEYNIFLNKEIGLSLGGGLSLDFPGSSSIDGDAFAFFSGSVPIEPPAAPFLTVEFSVKRFYLFARYTAKRYMETSSYKLSGSPLSLSILYNVRNF